MADIKPVAWRIVRADGSRSKWKDMPARKMRPSDGIGAQAEFAYPASAIDLLQVMLDDAHADFKEMERLAHMHKARAERLAEALLEARWMIRGLLPDETYTKWDDLLREHGQEVDNG